MHHNLYIYLEIKGWDEVATQRFVGNRGCLDSRKLPDIVSLRVEICQNETEIHYFGTLTLDDDVNYNAVRSSASETAGHCRELTLFRHNTEHER